MCVYNYAASLCPLVDVSIISVLSCEDFVNVFLQLRCFPVSTRECVPIISVLSWEDFVNVSL
jgi:hypothetical protein